MKPIPVMSIQRSNPGCPPTAYADLLHKLHCPACMELFDPPFKPDPAYRVCVDGFGPDDAYDCDHCHTSFRVTAALWKFAGYTV